MKIKRNIKALLCSLCLFFIGTAQVSASSYSRLNIETLTFAEESASAKLSFAASENVVSEIEFVFFSKDRSSVFWAGTASSWEEKVENNQRVFEVQVPVPQKELGLLPEVQVNVYDVFDTIIAQGRGSFNNTKGALLRSFSVDNIKYDPQSIGIVSFNATGVDLDTTLTAEIRSDRFSGKSSATYYIKPTAENNDGSFLFEQLFPELDPGKYYLFLKREDKGAETSWQVEQLIQQGDVLRFYGNSPDPQQVLPSDQKDLSFYIEGYVPPQKNYKLLATIEQKTVSGQTITESSFDTEKDLFFEDHERFTFEQEIPLSPEASRILMDLEIVSAVAGEKGLKKQIIYTTNVAPKAQEVPKEPEVQAPVSSVPAPQVSPSLIWWQWGVFILAGILFGFLLWTQKKGRYLKGFVLFLASSAMISSVSAAEITGYTETISIPSSTIALNPTSGAVGFNTLPVQVRVTDNDVLSTATLFELPDIKMTQVQISFKAHGAPSYNHNPSPVDAEDVFLTESNLGISGYDTLYTDVILTSFPALSDGAYDVRIRINFDSGDWVEAERENYFFIDKTAPVVSVLPTNPEPQAYKDFTVSCGGETMNGCVTPSALSATIRVQGNFCDGVDDGDKLCDTTANKRTFELCDAAGNCSAPTNPPGDFFLYDKFPPKMTGVELRDDGAGAGQGVGGDGAPRKSQSAFDFDIEGQQDNVLNDPFAPDAGYDADPNMCGDYNTAGLCRNYDITGNPVGNPVSCAAVTNRSALYSGPDGEGGGSTICRQRNVVCSNGPGHRGVWNRSTVSSDLFRCYDVNAGTPAPSPSCEAGYSFDSANGVCKKTCGDGYYDNAGVCETIKQCDPTVVGRLTGVTGAWLNDAGATKSNQVMDYDPLLNSSVGAGACSWGCAEGYVVDDALNPTTCKLFEPTDIEDGDIKAWMKVTPDMIVSNNGDPVVDGYAIQGDDVWVNASSGVEYDPYIDSSGDILYKVDPLGLGNDMIEVTDEGAGFESADNFQVTASEGWTVYYVAKMTDTGNDKRVLNAEIPENGSFGFVYCDSGPVAERGPRINGIYLQGGNPSAECSAPATRTPASALEDLHMFGVIRYPDGTLDLRNQDGSIQTFSGTSAHSYDWTVNQGKFSASKVGSTFLMGEMVVYDKAISNTDRDDLEAYLKKKWGLQKPDSLPGLQVWLDATDYNGNGTTPTDEATLAANWQDKSGNNNDYVLVSGPTFEATGIHNKASVEVLSGGFNAPVGANIPADGEFTTYYVAQKLASDSNGRVVEAHLGNWLFGYWGSNRRSIYLNGSPSEYNSGVATSANITDKHMFGLIRETSGALQFRDQNGQIKQWGSSNSPAPADLRWDINQGQYSGESSDFYIGEFIQYDRSLSPSEREVVEKYLKNKWGL